MAENVIFLTIFESIEADQTFTMRVRAFVHLGHAVTYAQTFARAYGGWTGPTGDPLTEEQKADGWIYRQQLITGNEQVMVRAVPLEQTLPGSGWETVLS